MSRRLAPSWRSSICVAEPFSPRVPAANPLTSDEIGARRSPGKESSHKIGRQIRKRAVLAVTTSARRETIPEAHPARAVETHQLQLDRIIVGPTDADLDSQQQLLLGQKVKPKRSRAWWRSKLVRSSQPGSSAARPATCVLQPTVIQERSERLA